MALKPLVPWAVGSLVALLVAGVGYFSLSATDRPAAAAVNIACVPMIPRCYVSAPVSTHSNVPFAMEPTARASLIGRTADQMASCLRRRTILVVTLGTIPTSNFSLSPSGAWLS